MAIRLDQNSIPFQVCLGQVRYICSGSDMNGFLVSDHMDSVPVDVAACNLFVRKLNFFARAAQFAVIVAAVSIVAGATGLSHILITISLAACNRGACSGMSSTCANAGSNKQAAEGT